MKLSIIMPGRREPFMQKTIDSFLTVSELGDDVEIFAVLDGPTMTEPIGDKRLKVIRIREQGMRAAINAGLAAATGDFVMKLDAHCAFGGSFDKNMVENCPEDRLLIPRRFSLDDTNWNRNRIQPARDYHYLCFPAVSSYGYAMTPQKWGKKEDAIIDDTMSFQGSCWLANREYFMSRVGYLDDRKETYGSFAAEQLEIGLKYWLGGGEVKVNKDAWYAHLWKMPRHYDSGEFEKKGHRQFRKGWYWATKHWINNEEPGMIHPFSWLLEKFWPVPSWPEDRNLWRFDGID